MFNRHRNVIIIIAFVILILTIVLCKIWKVGSRQKSTEISLAESYSSIKEQTNSYVEHIEKSSDVSIQEEREDIISSDVDVISNIIGIGLTREEALENLKKKSK